MEVFFMKRTNEIKFAGNYVTILGEKLSVGDKAKDFTVLDKDLKEVKLSDFEGKVKIIYIQGSDIS